MEGASNECTREISLATATDCETLLNPLSWTTNMLVLGGRAPSSVKNAVDVTSWYEFDSLTGVYTDNSATALSASVYGTGCGNALQEVVYRVYL